MNSRMAAFAVAMLFACLFLPDKTCADVIIAWDWDDGTTQGWGGSSTASNVGNMLAVTNAGNGSVQFYGPDVSSVDFRGLSTISFDLSITSYSTVASPSDLTFARLVLNTPSPMDPVPEIRFWNLDLTNLAFGQTRTFNLSIQDASGSGSLETTGFLNLTFADSSFTSNNSSALLDNFVVSNVVPEPSTILLLGTGLAGLCAAHRRRKRR